MAGRLWRGALQPPAGTADVALAADRLCHRLRTGLGRWLGRDGYRALLDRARTAASQEHAVLSGWPCLGEDPAAAQAALQSHGEEALAAGILTLVAALVELLGSIMGKEIAVQLVEQAGRTDLPATGQGRPGDGRDG